MNNIKSHFGNVITLVEQGKNGEGSLYIGNLKAANSHKILSQYDINSIVTLCQDEPGAIENHESISAHYYYPIYDHPTQMINFDVFKRLSDVVKSDMRNGRNVLVHCYAGRSRSSTFILFHQMTMEKYSGVSLKDLLIKLHTIHPLTAPNSGFMSQLDGWEKENRHSVTSKEITDIPTAKLDDQLDHMTSQVTLLGGTENLYPIRHENLGDFFKFKPSYMQDDRDPAYVAADEQDDWLKKRGSDVIISSHGPHTINYVEH